MRDKKSEHALTLFSHYLCGLIQFYVKMQALRGRGWKEQRRVLEFLSRMGQSSAMIKSRQSETCNPGLNPGYNDCQFYVFGQII